MNNARLRAGRLSKDLKPSGIGGDVANKKKAQRKKLYCSKECTKQCLNTCAKLARRLKKRGLKPKQLKSG
jgi:hypothetical protein